MSDKYTLTVGLEIHAELNTKTKMFCNSFNGPDETKPNVNICPVCMGYPGTLPVINKEAVKSILRLGASVGGEIADYTEFDRKNYFYPDIPKGYQISQYKYPLVKGGELGGVKLTRVHLEEDTAKSIHGEMGESLLNFNRAGAPLMELVTEPVIHEAEAASNFAKELQLLLTYLGIAEANMEKGEMRVEANISVSSGETLGTKVEVKNLNSFRSVERAIKYEYERQTNLLEKGEKVIQETRGWDENKGQTISQRVKEDSHDYRYFPDPDLPKLFISEIAEFSEEALKASLPELPWVKRERLIAQYQIKETDTEIYVQEKVWGEFFESVAKLLDKKESVQLASNYITSDLKSAVDTKEFVEIIKMIEAGEISSRGAKDILKVMQSEGGKAREIAEKFNLLQSSDTESLEKIAQSVIESNANAVEEYRKGKLSSLQFLIGQAMKESKGSANPQMLKSIFEKLLQ